MTLLTPKEVAARLQVHPRTVYRLIDSGELEGYAIGGSIRIDEAAYNAYIERSRITPIKQTAANIVHHKKQVA